MTRVGIVTGAASGLGEATARMLRAEGVVVYGLDVNPGPDVIECDVTNAAALGRVVDEAVSAHGRLDIMANIAGVMSESKILDLEESDLDRLLTVNFKGTLFGCQAAGRVMRDQGSGSIINMASAAIYTATPKIGAYAITKAAVVSLTQTLAVELGKFGVRVNVVAPGFVPTPMSSTDAERMAMLASFTPLRRLGTPEDIAAAVCFLASDGASFITGQCLSPNGGVAMRP